MIDLEKIIDWLGPQGAIAGIIASDLTISEIVDLASKEIVRGHAKLKREEVAAKVVMAKRRQMTKSPDELMTMDSDALRNYFLKIKFSREEILSLLDILDIRPGSIARKNLTEFAAREISDIGMYKRVAQGDSAVELDDKQNRRDIASRKI